MTPHDHAIKIIEDFGIQPKKIGEILGIKSGVYKKMKATESNRFSAEDLEKIKSFYKTKITALD